MRLIICLLTVSGAVASAQQYSRELIVVRLNNDLATLKNAPTSRNVPLFRECLGARDRTAPRPQECGTLDRLIEDFAPLHAPGWRHFPTEVLSANLINMLSGRELEPDALTLLTSSLVDAIAITDRSVEVNTRVSRSSAFRDALMRAYTGLLALGINRARAESFLGNFATNAENMSKPRDFIPIPPARPF